MKKIFYYGIISIISAIFLAVRFAFFLFVFDNSYLSDNAQVTINMYTYMFVITLIGSLWLGFIESKKQ